MFNDNLFGEFIDIYNLLEQNNIIEIYNKYPYINKLILDFIKSKNIAWFKKLFDAIKNNMNIWSDKKLLNIGLSEIPNFNIQLRKYICANIFISFTYKYGQEQCCNNFKQILQQKKYWGMIIAPTGWGKSYTHILLFGLYFQTNIKNVMLITKRKDILTDQINNDNMVTKIKILQQNNLFPYIDYNVDEYIDNLDFKQLNANTHKIIIINIDKIINNYDKIKWKNIGMIIFDEMHWTGAEKIHTALLHIKKYVPYCIGSSATPMRIDKTNQTNIKQLFTNKLYELSYIDAWKYNVIVPITTILIKINDYKIFTPDTPDTKHKSKTYAVFDKKGKTKLLQKLKYYYDEKSIYKKIILYFRSRKSLLEWYKFIIKKYFIEATKHISFSYTKTDAICETINTLQIQYKDIDNGIINFKNKNNNAILFVVDRATEGFDDNKVDICCDMDYIIERNMLKTIQKIGRCQRIEPTKSIGYYICPIASDTEESYKKQVAQVCNNYISYITQYATISNYTKSETTSITINLIKTFEYEDIEEYNHDELLVDMNCLKYGEFDEQQQFNEIKNTIKNEQFYDKKDYIEYAQQNKLPSEPNIKYAVYWRGWYDFMGIDTKQFITYKKWNNIYAEITNVKQYEKLCKQNKNIPLYPNEIYKEYDVLNNKNSRR